MVRGRKLDGKKMGGVATAASESDLKRRAGRKQRGRRDVGGGGGGDGNQDALENYFSSISNHVNFSITLLPSFWKTKQIPFFFFCKDRNNTCS